MTEVGEAVRIVKKGEVPEEIADYEALGIDDKNHLVGVYESGETKRLNNLGHLVLELAKKTGVGEEVGVGLVEPESQQVKDLKERNRALEEQLEKMRSQKEELDQQLSDLRTEFRQQLEESEGKHEKRYNDLKNEFEEFKRRTKDGREELQEELTDIFGETQLKDITERIRESLKSGETHGKTPDKYIEELVPFIISGSGKDMPDDADEKLALYLKQELADEIEKAKKERDEAAAKFKPGNEIGIKNLLITGRKKYLTGFEVDEVQVDEEGKITKLVYVKQSTGEKHEIDNPGPDTVKKLEEIPEEDRIEVGDQPSKELSKFAQRRNRVAGRIGRALLGSQVRAHNGAYNLVNRRGRVASQVTEEEIIEGYAPEERRTGAAAMLGATAVVAAGVIGGVIGYFIGRHTGHDYNEVITTTTTIPGGGGGGHVAGILRGNGWEYVPPHGTVTSADQLQFYNDGVGNHAFAVDLSHAPSLDMGGHPGDYTLTGPSGTSVDLKWKGNGPLSKETFHRLKEVFPNIKFQLGHLFYKDHVGPGPQGWVKHYVTSLRYK